MKTIPFIFISVAFVLVIFTSCKKDEESPVDTNPTPTATIGASREGGGVTDIDGNSYHSVIITVSNTKSTNVVEQEWMSENLKTTKYANGSLIDTLEMAFCNDDSTTVSALGYLYTWDALMNYTVVPETQGACPDGWHLPSIDEYNTLITALGGASVAGKKMKSTDTTYWDDISLADNASGFNAQGGGWYSAGMYFFYQHSTMYWTSTEDGTNAKIIQLNSNSQGVINSYGSSKTVKNSCRCIKN